MSHTYEIIQESRGYVLYRRDDGKFTVVEKRNGQVFNAMPGDAPKGGGNWMARATPYGIDYVSHGYSESYARRIFRELTTSA